MWLEAVKWVKMGSNRAQLTRLCTPNGVGSVLGEIAFLTHF